MTTENIRPFMLPPLSPTEPTAARQPFAAWVREEAYLQLRETLAALRRVRVRRAWEWEREEREEEGEP